MRRSRHYPQKTAIHGQFVDAVSISERPACIEDRAVPGQWEGGLVFGSGKSQIATLVERQTRHVMLVKLDGKDSQTVVNALIKNARKLPQELFKSLSWDRDTQIHTHKQFTMATNIQGLLLRSTKPVAMRKQRKYEWAAQAVHVQGHGCFGFLTDSTQRDRETIEREAAQDARLPHTR
jgi:IS30 family transposase